jgi:hypothetical protein
VLPNANNDVRDAAAFDGEDRDGPIRKNFAEDAFAIAAPTRASETRHSTFQLAFARANAGAAGCSFER